MPPRTVKKTPSGPGSRRGGRGGKGTLRAQNKVQLEETVRVEEPAKVEEPMVVDVKVEEVKSEEKKKTLTPPQEKVVEPGETTPVLDVKSDDNEVISLKKDGVKESVDEYERGERLDLDDNDPEYEPEEYGGVDYDEKELEQEDLQEEDPVEVDVGEEEETEMVEEEEIEEIQEKLSEEYGGVDYDEKELEQEDLQEEDPVEVDVGEEEETEMVEEEEIEEIQEKLEEGEGDDDEEDDNDGVEEHAKIVSHAEEEEHHDVVKERRKRKEFEIFVGGLDKDASEDDLRKAFGEVGDVTEVRLMMNPQTKKNKGFAFLRFATVEQAKRACSELKNPVVHGKQCGVTPSQDSDTLFLGNICKTWTKEALRERERLKHYGVDTVEDLTLVEDSNSEGTNRGFAFLEFSTRSDAMDAFKRLQKRDITFGVDRPAKVSFADSFIDPGDEIMAQVKTVFVDGLPASWDEDRVRELLKTYGEVEKVELARNMPSAKRKDFGFVTFSTHDTAVICAKSINNEELGEGDSKAKVRARLSRPLQRGKGKHVTHAESRHGRGPVRSARGPWSRPAPRGIPFRGARSVPARIPPVIDRGFKRPSISRDRRQLMAIPPRPRAVVPPQRSYVRRHTGPPPCSKSSLKRDYSRHDDVPPSRSRANAEYPRGPSNRRMSYRDEYSPRDTGYSDLPRGPSRPVPRREYVDDGYVPRYDRPPPTYHEGGRAREYDTVPGSKRTYSSLDDVPPRYADTGVRQSRARLDYEHSGGASQYGDIDADRLGRSNLGYSGSRSSISSQDSRGLYSSRQGMGYSGGSYSGNDMSGMYSSGYGSDYVSRGSDVGGSSSYSSLYSSRGLGNSSSYMGSGSSGSYY